MTELSQYPLVTFALFVYKQEKYVRGAVESALAQDYQNLEIVISDDASPDSTWKVIEEVVAGYTGPHRLVLNRNPANLGVTSHVNKVFTLAGGELVVVAAGDDISVPTRVTTLVRAWEAQGRCKGMLHSAAQPINPAGQEVRQLMRGVLAGSDSMSLEFFRANRRKMLVHGATAAYTRSLLEEFGALQEGGLVEDAVLTFRAALSGKIIFVDEALVQYRIAETTISGASHTVRAPGKWVGWMSAQELKVRSHLLDYQNYLERTGAVKDQDFCNYLKRTADGFSSAKAMASPNLMKRMWGLWNHPGFETVRDKLEFGYRFFR